MSEVIMVFDPSFESSIIDGASAALNAAGVRLRRVAAGEDFEMGSDVVAVVVSARIRDEIKKIASAVRVGSNSILLIATVTPGEVESVAGLWACGVDGVALEDPNLGADILLRMHLANAKGPEASMRLRQLERENRDMLALMRLSEGVTSAKSADEVLQGMVQLWREICPGAYLAYWERERGGDWQLIAELAAGAVVLNSGRRERHLAAGEPRAPERGPVHACERVEAPATRPHFLRWAPSWKAAASTTAGAAALLSLRSAGATPGKLVLGDTSVEPTPLLEREPVLRSLASLLGAALVRAAHHEQVRQAYQQLKTTQRQLVHAEKFAAMGLLSAEVAHEINNPASFVISNLSVLEEYTEAVVEYVEEAGRLTMSRAPMVGLELQALHERLDLKYILGDLHHLLERSLGGMHRIHQIVHDLRLMAHEGPHEPGWVGLPQLVDGALTLVRHDASRRAELCVELQDTPAVYTDANRLSQVVLNLVINALQSIEIGHPEANQVTIDAVVDEPGDRLDLRISDTGSGISDEDMALIFEPFFTTKKPGKGTGLGLSISRDLVRSLGGELRVSSQLGVGTTMTIELPIRSPTFKKPDRMGESGTFDMPSSDEIELARMRWRNAAGVQE
ncbi:hypothetical protein DL240_05180 [Lujinxingia litoralis]|uniref:histidine kinase n=1 Tax=Lujinxingia litoralis TaxID=2211119 RepID=A0A328C982_9DELT|nr:ATP-binding protein [Lujinxingia litoralis]RAL23554.1 hypothetical protein DL240_05180 [Lujinxingia litoralis]